MIIAIGSRSSSFILLILAFRKFTRYYTMSQRHFNYEIASLAYRACDIILKIYNTFSEKIRRNRIFMKIALQLIMVYSCFDETLWTTCIRIRNKKSKPGLFKYAPESNSKVMVSISFPKTSEITNRHQKYRLNLKSENPFPSSLSIKKSRLYITLIHLLKQYPF